MKKIKGKLRAWGKGLGSNLEDLILIGTARLGQLHLKIELDRGSVVLAQEIRDVKRTLPSNLEKQVAHVSQIAKIH